MTEIDGNSVQTRAIAEQVGEAAAEAALLKFTKQHPEVRKMEVPPPIKWASAIIAGIAVLAVGAYFNWLTESANQMQLTLARMDERLGSANTQQNQQNDEIRRRISRLESFHEAEH